MTSKRSEALRRTLALTLERDASTPAPVSITGAGLPPPAPVPEAERKDESPEVSAGDVSAEPPSREDGSLPSATDAPASVSFADVAVATGETPESGVGSAASTPHQAEEAATVPTDPPQLYNEPISDLGQPENDKIRSEVSSLVRPAPIEGLHRPVIYARPPSPSPGWVKLSVTIEQRDVAILDRFHEDARAAGLPLRKGGNPSMFIRAALRMLDEMSETDPEGWASRVAAVSHHDRHTA